MSITPVDPFSSPLPSPRLEKRRVRVIDFSELEAPKELQFDHPGLLRTAQTIFSVVGVVLLNIILNVVLLGAPLICRIYSYYKLHPFESKIEEKVNDALFTSKEVKAASEGRTKTFASWFSKENRRSMHETCKEKYVAYLEKTQDVDPVKSTKEAKDFYLKILKIYKMVDSRTSSIKIRKKIHEAMQSSVYQALKDQEVVLVEYLQVLSVKFSSADCRDIVREYGRDHSTKAIPNRGPGRYTWDELARVLDSEVDGRSFKRNRLYQNIIWGVTHPSAAMTSMQSEFTPMNYYPHAANPDMYAGDFSIGDKSMRFCYGPTPTGDAIHRDGVLPYMQKLRERGYAVSETRINLQTHFHIKRAPRGLKALAPSELSNKSIGEHLRVCEMLANAAEYPEENRMMSLAWDTKARKMGSQFIDPEVEHFQISAVLEQLARYYLGHQPAPNADKSIADRIREGFDEDAFQTLKHDGTDNGWYIPEHVLPAEKVVNAFCCAASLFDDDRISPPILIDTSERELMFQADPKEIIEAKKDFGNVMLLTIEGMVSLAQLYESFKHAPTNGQLSDRLDQLDEDLAASRVYGHCKQDIDRGVMNNIILRLLHRTMTDTSALTQEEFHEIVGGVLIRARVVDGRTIQWKRYKHLSNFLKYFSDQTRLSVLHEKLNEFLEDDFIEASNPVPERGL